ncbi:MAG: hypothetical protein CL823_06580 [Crocinitomicaceae bacterium]|nr:hypothetical protein [Crocinitomicaceae bacterium]
MKLPRYFTLAVVALIATTSLAQSSSEKTVIFVGDEGVSLSDFQHIYNKNNKDSVVTKEALDEYMDLFIKFKLKVKEAEALGMDTVSDFTRELAGYRKQLARPYLIDTDLLDEIVMEAYERTQIDVRARHILVTVGLNAEPADTLRAWNRCNGLRDRIVNGENFEKVAKSKNGSDDPSAIQNGGDLGWFSAFSMVYPFEQAAYSTPEGELSEIVRTRFGYHFLEVTGKRPARGEVHVAHIMVRVADSKNKMFVEKGKTAIDFVDSRLKAGEAFESLALKYSEDESSASKGGVLNWFGSGKMIEEFEDAAFGLENDGDISEPFLTDYGWHIVKRLGYKEPQSFEEAEKALRKKVSRDVRAEVTKTSFINKLKKEYNYYEIGMSVSALVRGVNRTDSVFYRNHPISGLSPLELNRSLFSVAGKTTTVRDFIDYTSSIKVKDLQRHPEVVLRSLINELAAEKILAHEDKRLEAKHNDFRLLIKEYHDGILLFELTDQMVWSKAVKDSTGLEDYHTKNAEKFMWDERADLSAYICENEEVAGEVKKAILEGKSVDEYRESLLPERPLAIRIEKGLFPKGTNDWADSLFTKRDNNSLVIDKNKPTAITLPIGEGGFVVMDVRGFVEPTPKTLEEARGQVIASYQDHLEEEWVNTLKGKYTVTVYEEVLYELID